MSSHRVLAANFPIHSLTFYRLNVIYSNVKAEKNQVVYADAAKMSEIRDTIFGFIEPGKDEWRILDLPLLQRLRRKGGNAVE
jgi:hypothetical protein